MTLFGIKIIRNFKDKRIRILKSKNFVKLYKARNAAIKKSKGEFIAFLDLGLFRDICKTFSLITLIICSLIDVELRINPEPLQ